jgi:septum formation protein
MLEAAGVPVAEALASDIDEAGLRDSLWTTSVQADQAAMILAEHKAYDVDARSGAVLTLAADQILETREGTWPAKPQTMMEAREQLMMLRGKRHRLVTAAVLVQDDETVWDAVDEAYLTMRDFDIRFLDRYLETVGEAVLTSVGGYQIEGPGVQLFSSVVGTAFTILGLPMVPLLAELRTRGVLRS